MENKNDYLMLIDSTEFQSKILDYITSKELDEMLAVTIFADKPECKQAMIHGMIIASMLTSKCEYFVAKQET